MINKHQLEGWVAARYPASTPLDAELRSGMNPMNAGSTERSVLANTAPMVSGERRVSHWKSMRDLRPQVPCICIEKDVGRSLETGEKNQA